MSTSNTPSNDFQYIEHTIHYPGVTLDCICGYMHDKRKTAIKLEISLRFQQKWTFLWYNITT